MIHPNTAKTIMGTKTDPRIFEVGISPGCMGFLTSYSFICFRFMANAIRPMIRPIPAAENAACQPILFRKIAATKLQKNAPILIPI